MIFRLVTRKEGANQGREFFSCPKGRNGGCKFFEWADEDPRSENNPPRGGRGAFRGGTRGGGTTGRGGGGNGGWGGPGAAGGKRKCGQCRQEGKQVQPS